MVKGTAKQAVIVRGDKSGFEQAIFILSPEEQGQKISSAEEFLKLADSIASRYTVSCLPSKGRRKIFPYIISFAAGSGITALVYTLLPMLSL